MHLLKVAVIGLIIGCAIAEEANKLSEDSFGNGDIKEFEKKEDAPYWWMVKGSPFKRSPEVFTQPIVVAAAYANNPFLNGGAGKPFEVQAATSNDLFGAGGSGAKLYAAPGYLPPDLPQPIRCSGQSVCVPANNCLSGSIDKSQVISFNQNCNPGSEVCCAVRTPPPPPPPRPTIPPTYAPRPTEPQYTPCIGDSRGCVPPNLCINGVAQISALGGLANGPSSQKCYAPEVCCRIPEAISQPNEQIPNREYIPAPVPQPTTIRPYVQPVPIATPRPVTRPPFTGVSYIPPRLPSESSNREVINRPPKVGENELAEPIVPNRPFEPVPAASIPVGCAAALNCTPIEFCDANGFISKSPVQLSETQAAYRVPLTDCRDLGTGNIGKCCRDPDYTDPWPTGRLGQYVPNELNAVFDNGQYKPEPNRAAQQIASRPIARRPNQIGQPIISGSAEKSPAIIPTAYQPNTNVNYQPIAQGSCHTRNINAAPRGNGPIDAGFGEFPWQAMILKESTKTLLCGGAIIENTVVATSAKCVDGQRPNDVLIKAGEWQLGVDDAKPFQLVRVTKISMHPAYQPTSLDYDIALLHLELPLKYDSHIGPICIEDNEPAPSENCVTTGWGKEVLKVHAQDALPHAVPIQPVPQGQCQASLNGFNSQCSVCGAPKADACEADVGSALACEKGNGQYYLKGIYSTENGCGNPNQLITFTKPDTNWIKNAMRNPGQQLGEYVPAPNTPQLVKTAVPSVTPGYLPPQ